MNNLLDFDNYILESNSIYLLDPDTKSTLLKLDEKYHKLIEKFRTKYVAQTVSNIKEEFDKFMNARNLGQKYYPQLEIKNSDVDMKIYDDMGKLKEEINKIKDNPYKKPDFKEDRTNDSDDVLEAIEDALDELGYDFDVQIDTGMLPRMNVKMGRVNINKTSKFSDEDIEGLIQHEIRGHVGRRYYGMQTGLWLFAYGTQSSSTLDEGLAVWNSLNKVKHKKDNVMFNIAMKTCVSYLMFEMDFCDLFDWVKKKAPGMTDYTAFKTVMRPRRRNKDCSIKSGEPMTTYYKGWKMVNDMDNKMRNDILHYNIGPDQLFELDNIKEFLKVNHFEPLKEKGD